MDQVDLPQRAAPVEVAGVQPGRLLGELLVVTWRGEGQLPDVIFDVEVGVLDPVRLIEAERHVDEPATERRDQVQPRLDQVGQAGKRQRRRRRSDGSRMQMLPTWPYIAGVSMARNAASRPVSCCMTRVRLYSASAAVMQATNSGASGSTSGRNRPSDASVRAHDELLEVPLDVAGRAVGVRQSR